MTKTKGPAMGLFIYGKVAHNLLNSPKPLCRDGDATMPYRRKLQRQELRVVILRAMIEIVRTYYQANFKTDKFGSNIELGFVLFAVLIGQAENQLMTATDISSYLGMPRPTVARKLKQLGRLRPLRTKRDGKRVCYWIENPNTPEAMKAVDKVVRIIKRANRQLSKMVDTGMDHRVANP